MKRATVDVLYKNKNIIKMTRQEFILKATTLDDVEHQSKTGQASLRENKTGSRQTWAERKAQSKRQLGINAVKAAEKAVGAVDKQNYSNRTFIDPFTQQGEALHADKSRTFCGYCKGGHWICKCPLLHKKHRPNVAMPADIAKNMENVPERKGVRAFSVDECGVCLDETHTHKDSQTHSSPTKSTPNKCDASVEAPVCASTDDDDLFIDAIEYDDDYILSDDEYHDADFVAATLKTVPTTNNDDSLKQYAAKQNAHKQSVLRSFTQTDRDFMDKAFTDKLTVIHDDDGLKKDSDRLRAVSDTLTGVENTASVATTNTHTHVINFKRSKKAAKNKLAKLLKNKERRKERGESVSRLKLILKNCRLNGIKCTALIDDGADVSGIKPAFIAKHKAHFEKNQTPSTVPLKCVNETPLAVSMEYHDVNVELESFADYYDFHGFDMGGSYDFLLGVDWLSTYRAQLDHDPLATEKVKITTNENGEDTIHVLSTVNVVDIVDHTVHRESGGCTPQTINVGAVSACISGVSNDTSVKDSIELMTNKQFKREQKKIFRQQKR